MYRLTRISAAPASPLKIMIAKPDGPDAGLTAGGSFVIEPGDQLQVDAYVAGIIMGDASLAPHFECLPPWPAAQAPTIPAGPDPGRDETPDVPVPGRDETPDVPDPGRDETPDVPVPDAEPEPSRWEPTPRRRGR